jgi:hypothetical protein
MPPFGVTILATVPRRSEIPVGLMNYPVQDNMTNKHVKPDKLINFVNGFSVNFKT